jgi:hypothetical protein
MGWKRVSLAITACLLLQACTGAQDPPHIRIVRLRLEGNGGYPAGPAPLYVGVIVTISNTDRSDVPVKLELHYGEAWNDYSELLNDGGAQQPRVQLVFPESGQLQARVTFADGTQMLSETRSYTVLPNPPIT